MKWFQSVNFKRGLTFFSASYFLFILIPVLVLNVASFQAIRITEENAIRNNMAVLSQSYTEIDAKIKNIDSISPQILLNKTLLDLQNFGMEKNTIDYFKIWKSIEEFRNLALMERELTAAIYFSDSDIFLSSDFLCSDLTADYGKLYNFGDYTYQEFKEKYRVKNTGRTFFESAHLLWNGKDLKGILYGVPLSPTSHAYVYFLLDEEDIVDSLAPILDEGGSVYILDEKNQVLFSRGDTSQQTLQALPMNEPQGKLADTFFGDDSVATYGLSDYGFKYISVTPKSFVYNQVKYLRYLTVYLNIAAVVLAVGYALCLAFKNSRRLSGVLDTLESNPVFDKSKYQEKNIFEYINNSMLQLISNNQSLRLSEQAQIPILKAAFLDKLINGSFTDDNELKILEDKLNLHLENRYFCIITVFMEEDESSLTPTATIEGIEQFASKKQLALSCLEKNFGDHGLIYSRNIDQVAVLCCFKPEEIAGYRKIAEESMSKSVDSIYQQTGMLFKCVGSDIFENIKDIFKNYNLCRELFLHYSFVENTSVIMWNDLSAPQRWSMFVYPDEYEDKLLYQIKSGESDEACRSISAVLKKNLNSQSLSPKMKDLFISQLKITLLKSLEASLADDYEKKILSIDSASSAEVLRSHIFEIVQSISSVYALRNDSKAENLKKEMVCFINENFENSQLSLKFVSEHFNLSEAYFSQLFKELVGENFSVYLDKIRMCYAHTVLQENKLRIDDIARQCGYISTSTFRRAYKRYYGVSPSQSRFLQK